MALIPLRELEMLRVEIEGIIARAELQLRYASDENMLVMSGIGEIPETAAIEVGLGIYRRFIPVLDELIKLRKLKAV